MKEIKYYLKKHMISTVVAMLLYILQGLCIVALIICSNNIIDYGLLRYGYESVSPEALLETSFERRISNLEESEKNFVLSHYTLLNKDNMTVEEYEKYEQDYPAIAGQLIYKKNWIGIKDIEEQLNRIFPISTEDMIYEYINLGVNPKENQQNYIIEKIELMVIGALLFLISFAGANMLVASIASKVGYEERKKIIEGSGKGLKQSLDLQDRIKQVARWFYAVVLSFCGLGIGMYYYIGYMKNPIVDENKIIIWVISIIVFSVAIYSAISIRGLLNKGIFFVGKVAILGALSAIFESKMALAIIFGYGIMLSIVLIIRKLIKSKLKVLFSAHEDNIDNVDGQMSFVMNDENVTIEPVKMQKMVRAYLVNNEYLYRSSWILELLDNIDKVVVALFNFFGVIIVISAISYMYINLGVPIIIILPLLILYSF